MLRHLVLLVLVGFLAGVRLAHGASAAETRSYNATVKLFQDGLFEVAEKDCAEFVRLFPESEKLAEVILLQAQARLRLKQFDAAASLLTEKAAVAGKLADEFRFWQAEARFEKGDLAGAADAFAKMAADFPASARRLEASYDEAYARFSLGDTARVMALLRDPNGPFQAAAKARPDDDWALRGWLLLGEALLMTKQNRAAEEAIAPLATRKLNPELDWRRHFLLARVQLADNRFVEALAHATNLWTAATNTLRRDLLAEAAMAQGEILERLLQPEAALLAYERNLAEGVPAAPRRQALRKTIEISLRQSKAKELAQRLETLLNQHPRDEILDLARLTLGELRLKEYHTLKAGPAAPETPAALTNLLSQARVQFELLATNYPHSQLLGKAWLDQGWCFWEEGTNRLTEGLLAFKTATERLPRSSDHAIARFKWADCQFRARDFPGAISNYWQVVTNYTDLAAVTNSMVAQALYQIVRAGLDANDLSGASAAMSQILMRDPEGTFADRAELLVGQVLDRQGKPQAARALFADFVQRFTNSALLPEVKLAIARSHESERAWPAAIAAYNSWLAVYPSLPTVSSGMVAQASFDLARLTYQNKADTNALGLLTNFVARFPDHANVPLAQYLVGTYYFEQGEFAKAELHFQDKALFQNTNAALAELTYQSRLWAGRAAVARQSYRNARDYFDWLISNGPLYSKASPIPDSIVAEAYLLRGDTFLLERVENATNAFARFGEAINAFLKIADYFPTNEFAPLALGRIGDCHLQLAAQDPAQAAKRYDSAADAYRKVVDSPAGISVRSQAEIGLGIVHEKQAELPRPVNERGPLQDQALDRFLRVLYGKNLRAGEQPDPSRVKEAGLKAASLVEARKKWFEAIAIYQRLQTELPPLRARLDKKIQQAREALDKPAQ